MSNTTTRTSKDLNLSKGRIDRLIISSPYQEPQEHWHFDKDSRHFVRKEGRRPSGNFVPLQFPTDSFDPGVFREIPLVNEIRKKVAIWRRAGRPGITSTTRQLLDYWTSEEEFEHRRFFFCQIEAIETLIWLLEVADTEGADIKIPSDGGSFQRICAKMATGTGKTIVMAMLAAWQILNKVSSPTDPRFSKYILLIAPGLTVKSRLAVLTLSSEVSYYEQFKIIPSTEMFRKLRQGKIIVHNWHALDWETEEKIKKRRTVDKRGAKSDGAYVREILGDMANKKNILVINDEAHHAWRLDLSSGTKGVVKSEVDQATKWIGALDRIHRACGIKCCYDFSATPFIPTGTKRSEDSLFGWIVSDFGLTDAIESGLVKTPRVVIRDSASPNSNFTPSRLYHIYSDPEVKEDLNRRADASEPLPSLVQNAFYLLGYDWRETAKEWAADNNPVPPVMITVANRTETAARIKQAFDDGSIQIEELCNPERTLRIDSKVLERAESSATPIAEVDHDSSDGSKLTLKQKSENLRRAVDTVGQKGELGERIQNVISVGMLSEGWDAKTVTHIMGLRAFSSQLLCEQVVGRGLRRRSYEINPKTGMFDPEYVNIFGVPFTFLPHEIGPNGPPPPEKPRTKIEPDESKAEFEISWPNIIRIDHRYTPRLSLDWENLHPLKLSANEIIVEAKLAPIVDGKPDIANINSVALDQLTRDYRLQTAAFDMARKVYQKMRPEWSGDEITLVCQLVRLTEDFIGWKGLSITPSEYYRDIKWRRLILALRINQLVQHIWSAIRFENTKSLEPIFDTERPISSTSKMGEWYTKKKCGKARHSHINYCVYDSTWEKSDAHALDVSPEVHAWVKNDHLGFEILYLDGGIVRKYRPDFLIRLASGEMLILETKGVMGRADKAKLEFLDEWVKAVNSHGGFGRWHWAVSDEHARVGDILERFNRLRTKNQTDG